MALTERSALGLTASCRLNPFDLAAAKGIDVLDLSQLDVPVDHRRHRLEVDPAAFSGLSVIHDDQKLIVVNDGHTPELQATTVSHEIAHFLLDHPPGPAVGEFGRMLSKEIEDEATGWPDACSCPVPASTRGCSCL